MHCSNLVWQSHSRPQDLLSVVQPAACLKQHRQNLKQVEWLTSLYQRTKKFEMLCPLKYYRQLAFSRWHVRVNTLSAQCFLGKNMKIVILEKKSTTISKVGNWGGEIVQGVRKLHTYLWWHEAERPGWRREWTLGQKPQFLQPQPTLWTLNLPSLTAILFQS